MPPARPLNSLRLFRSRCARFESTLSQLVDGSIGAGDREALLRHLGDCASCRAEVAEIRRVRSLLGGARNVSPGGEAPSRLQERLVSIAQGAEDEPLWSRPFRRVEPQRLPSPRRRLRRRAAVAATALGTLAVAGGGVGYAAAPAAVTSVGDPTTTSRSEFAAARAEVPLAANAATAVIMAGDRLTASVVSASSLAPVASAIASSPNSYSPGSESAGSGPRQRASAGTNSSTVSIYRPAASTSGQQLTSTQSAAMLDDCERAAAQMSYTATERVLSRIGGSMISVDVAVAAAAGRGSELVVSDGSGNEIGEGSIPAPSAGAESLSTRLAGRYQLSGVGDVSLLGRQAAVVEAYPIDEPDHSSPSARWWIDQQTGVLLGRQSYDRAGHVVQSAMLTSLTTGGPRAIDPPTPGLTVSAVGRSSTSLDPAQLSGAGREVPQTLAGLPLASVQAVGSGADSVIHLAYTDGVWSVSMFERRGVLSGIPAGSVPDPQLDAYVSDGTPQMASWQSGDSVITVVTDGPDGLLAQAVHSLPHDQHRAPTTMGRVQAGWSRILTMMFR